jgi:hypothetical protein
MRGDTSSPGAMAMYYFGRNYSAALTGSVVRHARCEKCSCEYGYEMVRRATGSGHSPYCLNNSGAQDRANAQASRALRRALEKGADPVACPECGWYQADMVRDMRRRRGRRAARWGVGLLLVGAVLGTFVGIWYANAIRPWEAQTWVWVGGVVGGFVAAGAGCLLLKMAMIAGFDPNRDYPLRPAPYPGAPTPFIAKDIAAAAAAAAEQRRGGTTTVIPGGGDGGSTAPAVGAAPGALGYERRRPEILPGGWVTIQLARPAWPQTCCRCMADTQNMHLLPVGRLAKLPVLMPAMRHPRASPHGARLRGRHATGLGRRGRRRGLAGRTGRGIAHGRGHLRLARRRRGGGGRRPRGEPVARRFRAGAELPGGLQHGRGALRQRRVR